MTSAYDIQAWHDLFVMTGGAAAALTGLLFVAVSLNHEQILTIRSVSSLAAVSVLLLLGLLSLTVVGLAPGQPGIVVGGELLGIGTALGSTLTALVLRTLRQLERRSWRISRLALTAVSTLPLIAAAVSLMLGRGGGLYWLVLEVIAAFGTATYNAWVLLVEIRR